MTLTNHLLTGAVISKFLPWPIAIPVAFVSHFVLDAAPHFGVNPPDTPDSKLFGFKLIAARKQYKVLMTAVLVLDFTAAVVLSTWLIVNGHASEFYVGLVAYSPDLPWIYRFVVEEKFGKLSPTKGNRFIQFHIKIQKYERIWGGLVELAYAGVMVAVLR